MSDFVETMFYAGREKPWHGLGTQVDVAPTSADALRLAGLDWEVEKRKIFTGFGKAIPEYFANTRMSDESILGIVGNRYQVVQNKEAFEFTDALLGEGVTYETAGSLREGRQIWLLAKLDSVNIVGDEVEPYIVFTNTHDGTGAVRACMTPIRVVCNNTLNAALKGAKRSWSTPHRGDVKGRLDEAKQTLFLANKYLAALDATADMLANEKLTEEQVVICLANMFPLKKDATDREKQTVETMKDGIMACMIAPDILKFAGTKWGFINAVSDYVGHGDPIRKSKHWEENRWGSIIGGAPLFDKAVEAVMSVK